MNINIQQVNRTLRRAERLAAVAVVLPAIAGASLLANEVTEDLPVIAQALSGLVALVVGFGVGLGLVRLIFAAGDRYARRAGRPSR